MEWGECLFVGKLAYEENAPQLLMSDDVNRWVVQTKFLD